MTVVPSTRLTYLGHGPLVVDSHGRRHFQDREAALRLSHRSRRKTKNARSPESISSSSHVSSHEHVHGDDIRHSARGREGEEERRPWTPSLFVLCPIRNHS